MRKLITIGFIPSWLRASDSIEEAVAIPARRRSPKARQMCPGCLDSLATYARCYSAGRDISSEYARHLHHRADAIDKWSGGPVLLSDLTEELVSAWLRHLIDRGLARVTVRGYRLDIISLWRGAAEAGLCREPATRSILRVRVPETITEGWTTEEVNRLLVQAAAVPDYYRNGVKASAYMNAIIRVGYDSGARLGDIMNMRLSDLRADVWSWVQSKKGVAHSVRLHRSTLRAIEASHPPSRSLVFDWPYAGETFAVKFRGIVRAAGLRSGTFKYLRRTSGSYVDAASPGAGHRHLDNGAAVFDRYYRISAVADANRPKPPELES